MRKILNNIKGFTPIFIWNFARRVYSALCEIPQYLGPRIRTIKYSSFDVYYNRNNALVERLKKEPVFEQEMCESIERDLKNKGGDFLDIGANIGLVSLYIKSKLPQVTIYAFEPGALQRDLFTTTIKKNSLTKIKLFKEALGDKVGTVTFNVHKPKYAALDGLQDTHRRGKTTPVEVPMATLDTLKLPHVSVVKIDTEGAELLVLKGAKDFLKNEKPIIYLEIEPQNLKAYSYTKEDILHYLSSLGYSVEAITYDTYRAEVL